MSGKSRAKAKLLVFCGMTATGKSFLAAKWAEKTGCSYHNTDLVRKELAGVEPTSRQKPGVGQGIYSKVFTRQTYAELHRRAEIDLDLKKEQMVVIDGSYSAEDDRQNVVKQFSSRADICFIYCYCSEDLIKQRLTQRAEDAQAVSDGRWEVYVMQKKRFNVPSVVDGAVLLMLNTARPIDLLLDEINECVTCPRSAEKDNLQ